MADDAVARYKTSTELQRPLQDGSKIQNRNQKLVTAIS